VYDNVGDGVASKEGYCVISKTTAYKHVDCQDTSLPPTLSYDVPSNQICPLARADVIL
jgi:hypothetical protein